MELWVKPNCRRPFAKKNEPVRSCLLAAIEVLSEYYGQDWMWSVMVWSDARLRSSDMGMEWPSGIWSLVIMVRLMGKEAWGTDISSFCKVWLDCSCEGSAGMV
jgi:hypothetical protein